MDEAQIGVCFLVLPHISGLPVCSDFGPNHEQPSIPVLSRLFCDCVQWNSLACGIQFDTFKASEHNRSIPGNSSTCMHPSTDGVSSHTHMKVHCGEPKEKNWKANLPI